jgi:hypothetical protein
MTMLFPLDSPQMRQLLRDGTSKDYPLTICPDVSARPLLQLRVAKNRLLQQVVTIATCRMAA